MFRLHWADTPPPSRRPAMSRSSNEFEESRNQGRTTVPRSMTCCSVHSQGSCNDQAPPVDSPRTRVGATSRSALWGLTRSRRLHCGREPVMLECHFRPKSSPRRNVRIHHNRYLSFSEIFQQLQTGLMFLWSTPNRSISRQETARGRHTTRGSHPMRQLPCRTESRDTRLTRVAGHRSAMLLG